MFVIALDSRYLTILYTTAACSKHTVAGLQWVPRGVPRSGTELGRQPAPTAHAAVDPRNGPRGVCRVDCRRIAPA